VLGVRLTVSHCATACWAASRLRSGSYIAFPAAFLLLAAGSLALRLGSS
jgi:hypothetical protein